jgi:2-keto-3-deoxy-L-rhamnonate aldolase RhmA
MTAEVCAKEISSGAKFVVMGIDAMHLYNGACAQLEELKKRSVAA